MGGVDNRAEIREFLASRRAKVTPEQVGLPAGGGKRRVPGLRREEVAVLAGVSTDWYTGWRKATSTASPTTSSTPSPAPCNSTKPSAPTSSTSPGPPGPSRATAPPRPVPQIRPSVQRILDSMVTDARVRPQRTPGPPRDQRARPGPLLPGVRRPGPAREPRPVQLPRPGSADDFYPDWNNSANTTVALLRTEAGRDPHNKDLADLIGELATRSDAFRVRWAAHDVRLHRSGVKHFHHPVVGTVDLAFEAMDLPADPGLTLTAYTAEPGSPSEDALTAARQLGRHHQRHRPDRNRPARELAWTSARPGLIAVPCTARTATPGSRWARSICHDADDRTRPRIGGSLWQGIARHRQARGRASAGRLAMELRSVAVSAMQQQARAPQTQPFGAEAFQAAETGRCCAGSGWPGSRSIPAARR